MKKKRSSLPSSKVKETAVDHTAEIAEVKRQIEATQIRANQAESQGHTGTYWHDKLNRLNGRMAEISINTEA